MRVCRNMSSFHILLLCLAVLFVLSLSLTGSRESKCNIVETKGLVFGITDLEGYRCMGTDLASWLRKKVEDPPGKCDEKDVDLQVAISAVSIGNIVFPPTPEMLENEKVNVMRRYLLECLVSMDVRSLPIIEDTMYSSEGDPSVKPCVSDSASFVPARREQHYSRMVYCLARHPDYKVYLDDNPSWGGLSLMLGEGAKAAKKQIKLFGFEVSPKRFSNAQRLMRDNYKSNVDVRFVNDSSLPMEPITFNGATKQLSQSPKGHLVDLCSSEDAPEVAIFDCGCAPFVTEEDGIKHYALDVFVVADTCQSSIICLNNINPGHPSNAEMVMQARGWLQIIRGESPGLGCYKNVFYPREWGCFANPQKFG